jgi:predicted transcriptional regulator
VTGAEAGGGSGGVAAAIAVAVDAVAAVRESLGRSAASGADVRALERLGRRVDAARLAAVAAVDAAGVGAASGLTGTSAWLAQATQTRGAQAARDVSLATALQTDLPATRQALAQGDLSSDHAAVIAKSVEELSDGLTPDERVRIEASLVEKATSMDPGRLRRAARRALATLGRSAREVDAHHGAVLRSEEDRGEARTRLVMHDNGDGTVTGHFTVPEFAAGILRKAVHQLTAPRHSTGAPTVDDAPAQGIDWAHRQGLAFAQLLEHLPTDRLSSRVAATVVVTLDHDRLIDRLGAAGVDTGHELSAGQARRLACQAGIIPSVLGGASLPLDLGRASRLFTEAHRAALATMYDECAADGCDRPYAWSELHHQDPWSLGGRTDLRRAVPVCGFHHRQLHHPDYRHRIATDHRGIKTVTFARHA